MLRTDHDHQTVRVPEGEHTANFQRSFGRTPIPAQTSEISSYVGKLDAFKVVIRHMNDLPIFGRHRSIRTSEWAVAVGMGACPVIVFLDVPTGTVT